MSTTSKKLFSCHGICWIVGGLIGLVVAILIMHAWGLLVGIAVAIALALVLQRLFCAEFADTRGAAVASSAAGVSATGAQAEAEAARSAAAEAETAEAETAEAEAARAVAEAAEAEAEAAEAEAEAEAAAAEASHEAAEAEAAKKADAEAEAALAEVAAPATQDYDGDGVLEGEGEGIRPEALNAARDGKADDLKLIKGIGPKLEQLCNELGFYHFDQIAGWTADEVAWVNANLKGFKGRVSRDNWVAQAKTLAAGGTTEFAQRAEKTGLYDDGKR